MKRVYQIMSTLIVLLATACNMVITPVPTTPSAEEAAPQSAATPQAPEQSTAADGSLYVDPAGLFQVPIPTNWTGETVDGYAVFSAPEDQIQIYILPMPGEDIEAAVEQAWAIVAPDLELTLEEATEVPAQRGVERAVAFAYDLGNEPQEIIAAFGQLVDGVIYVLLLRGDPIAIAQRAAQLEILQSGFSIAALAPTDLTGVAPLPVDEELIAQLEAYILDTMQRFDVPGASIAIVQGSTQEYEIVYTNGFGVRELNGDEPVTPETLMMIGSTGKTMTTMLMATLVDEGLMTWDTPVREVLPEFAVADPELSERITMRNLVCGCTGVPRRDLEIIFNAEELTAEDVVESLATFEFFTRFGEAFQYSNQLVAVGGYAAAAAAGAEYGALYEGYVQEMEARVFEPIGMSSTTYSMEEAEANANHALPHVREVDFRYYPAPLSVEQFAVPVAPAGATWSNVLDMGRYLITELNVGVAPDGTRVVSEENLRTTWQPQVPVSAEASYGLGWIVGTYKGRPMIEHNGNTLGFTSLLAFLPDADVGIVILANAQSANVFAEAVRFRFLEMLFEQEPEFDEQVNFVYESMRRNYAELSGLLVAVEPEAVAPYVGRYYNDALGEVEVRLEDDRLLLDAGSHAFELRGQLGDAGELEQYITASAPLIGLPVRFIESQGGLPRLIVGLGVIEYRFEPVE